VPRVRLLPERPPRPTGRTSASLWRRLGAVGVIAGLVAAAGVAAAGALAACGAGRAASAPAAATTDSPPAVSAAQAEQAMASFNRVFCTNALGGRFYKKSTDGALADFWKEAEMTETAEDYYDLTHAAQYKDLVNSLCRGIYGRYGSDWMSIYSAVTHERLGPRANDDIMWMVIAMARAYRVTGQTAYRTWAKQNFDRAYARAWSTDFGGGLWWRSARIRPQKNTTTNAPAAIAACELARDFGTSSTQGRAYIAQAKSLYRWLRGHLFDARTGQVYDSVSYAPDYSVIVNRLRFTYNQGSFIGAAELLHEITGAPAYLDDAQRAMTFTRDHLTTNGILQNDADHADQDAGGFKGVFARWALRFVRENRITSFTVWLERNATVAWAHRNASGLVGYDWSLCAKDPTTSTTSGTPTHPLYSFDCSSAVAMMEIGLLNLAQ